MKLGINLKPSFYPQTTKITKNMDKIRKDSLMKMLFALQSNTLKTAFSIFRRFKQMSRSKTKTLNRLAFMSSVRRKAKTPIEKFQTFYFFILIRKKFFHLIDYQGKEISESVSF